MKERDQWVFLCIKIYARFCTEEIMMSTNSHYLTTIRKKNNCYLEKTTYRGIRSALTHLFRMSGQEMVNNTMKEMSQFMSRIQHTIVNG